MPSKSDRRGEDGVSEVIGFLITFSIIATILVAAMLAFNEAQERAEARVVAIQVDSIAQRVAGVMVEAGLFAESQDGSGSAATLAILIELPNDLQGDGYQVTIDADAQTVTVESAKGSATQALFGIGSGSIPLCDDTSGFHTVTGGNVYVVYDSTAAPADCLGLSNSPV